MGRNALQWGCRAGGALFLGCFLGPCWIVVRLWWGSLFRVSLVAWLILLERGSTLLLLMLVAFSLLVGRFGGGLCCCGRIPLIRVSPRRYPV